jgi:hypothetical protein
MSLKIRFHFDGRCSIHPRYNPKTDGRPQHRNCEGCESLYVIFLYSTIALRKAETGDGLTVRHGRKREEESESDPPEQCELPDGPASEPGLA